jgi:hypothetical protein
MIVRSKAAYYPDRVLVIMFKNGYAVLRID